MNWPWSVKFLKARPVVEGEHDKSWNDHGSGFRTIVSCKIFKALVCEKQKFIINSKTCRKKTRNAIILKLVINVEAMIQHIGNFLSNQMKIAQWNINLQLHLPNLC